MAIREYSLYDYLRYNASIDGSSPAIISDKGAITHQEYLQRVDQLASGLDDRGVAHGDRVCILAQNSAAYYEIYGACAKIGAVAYPINWRLSSGEVGEVIKLADPKMLLVGSGHLAQLSDSAVDKIDIRAVIGAEPVEGFSSLEEFYISPTENHFEVRADDPFVIISTAAVEGAPRGAVLSHENLTIAGFMMINALGLNAHDRHLAALPLFHITGLGLSLAMTQVGGANVVLESFDPGKAVKMIDDHNVTLMADFPPILSMLLDAREQTGSSWESLKYVVGLDAPDTIQRLYEETEAKFWTGFGQSETSGLVTFVRVDEKPGATGKPLPLVRLRCVDDYENDVAAGETGEIVVQGPVVLIEYWRDPGATEYAFRDGWHHTGDLGKLDDQGYLYYVGRKPEKDLIKSGGENIYPVEVEKVIQELPQVSAVCVIGVADEKWGEAVKALVELAPGETISAEELTSYVAEKIASYKKPRHIVFVDSLPRTSSGEIDRLEVKARYSNP